VTETKSTIIKISLVLFVIVIAFTACKKKESFEDEDGQSSIDSRNTQSENDAAVDDINDVISQQASLSGKSSGVPGATGVTGSICGLSHDTTASSAVSLN